MNRTHGNSHGLGRLIVLMGLVVAAGLLALCFTSVPGKIKRGLKEVLAPEPVVLRPDEEDIKRQIESRLRSEMEEELERELAALKQTMEEKAAREAEERQREVEPPPLTVPGTLTDVRKLRGDIPFHTEVKFENGGLASGERTDEESYKASYSFFVRVPKAAATMEDLARSGGDLDKVLPGLSGLVSKAKVSPWYEKLYQNKIERVKRDATALNEVLTKHNFYDCETILHLETSAGKPLFLLQAEMDVVSDGSDGDRLPTMPDEIVNSTYYQPFTSYGWPKKTNTPNPMVAGWEKRVANGEKEMADPATTRERKAWLKERIAYLKKGISDLKARSFLIAEYDPFIVIPMNLLTLSDPHAPKVGDYALVIHDNKVYPAIVGDAGPTFKVGEASLRMAKEINSKASPYSRPVSDLKVTYLVFCGSRDEKKGPPDYALWRQKCHDLVQTVGGLAPGVTLHEWKDLLPKPAPDPEPAPGGGP